MQSAKSIANQSDVQTERLPRVAQFKSRNSSIDHNEPVKPER